MMNEGIYELYTCVCRKCRTGHIRADLPAREGAPGKQVTLCPWCKAPNPGWVVFKPSMSHFMDIMAGTAEGFPRLNLRQ